MKQANEEHPIIITLVEEGDHVWIVRGRTGTAELPRDLLARLRAARLRIDAGRGRESGTDI